MIQFAETLSMGDMVYVSLSIDGQDVANISSTRFSSIDDVISIVYRIVGKFAGIAKLLIRNQSRGWSKSLPISSNQGRKQERATTSTVVPPNENGQYLIPW